MTTHKLLARPGTSESRACRYSRGFTIIEILVVIAIAAVLATLAAPNLITLVREQRVKTAIGDLYASLIFARSEAIKRNQYIGICTKTDDGWGCQNSADWSRGWIVYIDADGNGYPGATSDVLRRQDAMPNVTFTGTGGNVSYQRDGRLRATVADFVVRSPYSSDDTAVTARCLRLDASGRPNIKADTNKNAADGCQ